jgi:hypothetical protein
MHVVKWSADTEHSEDSEIIGRKSKNCFKGRAHCNNKVNINKNQRIKVTTPLTEDMQILSTVNHQHNSKDTGQ